MLHCALSLVGEPIMYPRVNELLKLMHAKGISTFLVRRLLLLRLAFFLLMALTCCCCCSHRCYCGDSCCGYSRGPHCCCGCCSCVCWRCCCRCWRYFSHLIWFKAVTKANGTTFKGFPEMSTLIKWVVGACLRKKLFSSNINFCGAYCLPVPVGHECTTP